MNEIVKYSNNINQAALTGLKAGGMDLFMLLCARAKDRGTELLTCEYAEIKKAIGLSDHNNRYVSTQFGKACDVINTLRFKTMNETTGSCKMVILFPTCENNPENETVIIRVNPDAIALLNEINRNFTRFELQEFVKLESKYSKSLYRLLKQYRSTGNFGVDAEKFRELMDCSPKYTNGEFMRKSVTPAVKELAACFPGLTVEAVRGSGRGRPIKEYRFTFQPEARTDPAADQKPKRTTRRKNSFNNFTERQRTDADWDELERLALDQ